MARHRVNKSAAKQFQRRVMLCFVGLMLSETCLAYQALPYQIPEWDKKNQIEKVNFNIPPQPLLSALRQYSEVTGQAVLFDDAMTAGVRSKGVLGDFNKVDALLKILIGTGLTASYSSDQAFTLKVADPAVHASPNSALGQLDVAAEGSESTISHYAARIQKPIELALCRSPGTRPGNYRLALQLWIAADGRVKKTRLLSESTEARNAQVVRALEQLTLDAPPSTMPEPLTVLLMPRSATSGLSCATTDHAVQ